MSTLEELRSALAGRYEIQAEIAHGGSSWVFAALDVRHARPVAIKVLRPELAASIGKERFLREIRVEAGLQHPNILALFDSGEVNGLPFFVMPLVKGRTLRARLVSERRLDIAGAVRITRQLCDALAYAHARGIVHRDVKPENVLMDDGHALLGDFGIARALWQATQDRVTGSGVAIGTAAYMSPEQGLAESAVLDGRSDQYSLACVLYEMLAGSPPHSGGNAVQLVARRAATPPESVRTTRSEVPLALDRALMRALARDPADRWPDMAAFGAALGEAVSGTTAPAAMPARRRRAQRLAGAGAIAVAIAVILWQMLTPPRMALDPQLLVVLPFMHESDVVDSALNGDDCSRLLLDAIAEWQGIRLVDDMRVRDARRRLGRAPIGVNEALRTASTLGAGLAIWGVVERAATPAMATTVRLVLYDVIGRGEEKANAHATIESGTDVLATFARLADSLLTRSIGAVGERRLPATRNFASLRAYVQGHRALDRWDLNAARNAFGVAASLDPDNGLAYLWQAQSAAWIRDPDAVQWGQAAARALRASGGLSARDSIRALALVALADRDYVAACDEYRALTRRDSLDFTGWFGLGECLTSDPVVEADSTSRSGWRFRTSAHEALTAYQRAIDLVPTFPSAFGRAAFQRLARYSYIDVRRYRPGLRPSDSARFAALPELAAETLAFVPFPERMVFAESAAAAPRTYLNALRRNEVRLTELTRAWAAADSLNPAALEALGLALEARGELDGGPATPGAGQQSALRAIRRARSLSSADDVVRLTAHETRVLLKLDRLAEAAALADSVVADQRQRSPTAASTRWLRGLAVLIGQGQHAIAWARIAGDSARDPTLPGIEIPASVVVAGAEALIYAAMGSTTDSVRAAIARGERGLVGVPTRSVELARQVHLEWPMTLAWPARVVTTPWTTRPSAGNGQLFIERALARGDRRVARVELERVEASAIRHRPSETGFDVVELSARLWMALGDTARALQMLDRSLDTVRDSGRQLITGVAETAGYVRTMALRAELAGRSGDGQRARQLADRVQILWGKGDALVRPQLTALERWR